MLWRQLSRSQTFRYLVFKKCNETKRKVTQKIPSNFTTLCKLRNWASEMLSGISTEDPSLIASKGHPAGKSQLLTVVF